ncbi:WYL domain-containing protein [Nocardioides sp. TF02-7]|uniref:helix-turn-helix transcriptional regulator n=1 Tax=Nocardioides sp. TF02-7 TaxID=2917724 RepID=UPI001F065C7B|nr:WYL domain-containing protein [Nocardioides sp. TF02-7]UMG94627.1 WYL domain-containing protein [Nocardioides sp. TF02-7]
MAHGGPGGPGHRARAGLPAGDEVGEERTYRLSRILAAEELAEAAQRAEEVDLGRAWQERSHRFRTGGKQVVVSLRLDPARRDDLLATALAVVTEAPEPDGRLRLDLTFQDRRHAEWAVWQAASGAEVLSPEWLRHAVRDRAAAIAERHVE